MVKTDVYLPDTCLQGEHLPAHVLWERSERVEIAIDYPESLDLESLFNVPAYAVWAPRVNSVRATDFEVNGYLGILFKARFLTDSRRREVVTFRIKGLGDSKEQAIRREVDLFRPSVSLGSVPAELLVEYDPEMRTYEVNEKIRVTNEGDGTAFIIADTSPEGDFERSQPEGTDDFEKAFISDLRARMDAVKSTWREYASAVDDFLSIAGNPMSLDADSLAKIESVFTALGKCFEEDEAFLEGFVAAIAVSYIRNIQLITELKSFLDYLNSIGEGRIVLLNAVEVLRPRTPDGNLRLRIQVTDLAYNDYPLMELPAIRVRCRSQCEIPVHLLFEWKQDNSRGEGNGRRTREGRSR